MKTILTISFLIILNVTFSQPLIPVAEELITAFVKLKSDANNKQLQADYIRVFPSDTKTFLSVFHTENFDQLYNDSDKYIDAFEKCGITFPGVVMEKCIAIGKNLAWDADAVGKLQQISVELAVLYPSVFVAEFKKLDYENQTNLITFYADVENHKAYPVYQELIIQLKNIDQGGIIKKLESARSTREMNKGH